MDSGNSLKYALTLWLFTIKFNNSFLLADINADNDKTQVNSLYVTTLCKPLYLKSKFSNKC